MAVKKHNKPGEGFYIALISVHGLFRATDPELGRDADTGGQIKYVLELAEALGEHPQVQRVDLLTRRVIDPKVDAIYGEPEETISDKARIIRIPCGPRRYLRKEVLWPHLDSFIDNCLLHFRSVGMSPDIIHSHYADAGYAGARLSQLLAVPLIHTGHSLGRVKLERLLEQGAKPASVEKNYNMNQRIEAEEITLGNAGLVIASTSQEVDEQYSQYENYHPRRMVVIPPGTSLERFHPPRGRGQEPRTDVAEQIDRFLKNPKLPMILALSRPDERKNIGALIKAYGSHPELRKRANLVIIAGNRDDIEQMEKGPQEVLSGMLKLIDRYDLYGHVAIPKTHSPDEVPILYRMVTRSKGVFINPALTEPFGLTLIEAAASGAPIIATNDGGPEEIIRHCRNGILINPLDTDNIADAMFSALSNQEQWKKWSANGLKGVRKHYSWPGHVEKYLGLARKMTHSRRSTDMRFKRKSRLPSIYRFLVCDVDDTIIGDQGSLDELARRLHETKDRVGFALATGRHLESALEVIRDYELPEPDVLITSVGTEIHYGHHLVHDLAYERHINYRWDIPAFREALDGLPGLKLQPMANQSRFKISYFADPEKMPRISEIRRHLRRLDLHGKVVYSHNAFLDVIPVRASKGMAIRYLAMRWGLDPMHILVAGDSGNDEEMLGGNTLAVVVGNHSPELHRLKGKPHVYFAEGHHARGIIQGIDHYDFFGDIHVPEDETMQKVKE